MRSLSRRRGAAAVETAVVLSFILLILFGLLDLGLAAINYNNLKDVAQQVSRAAIIRGQDAAPQFTVWGPGTYIGTAALGDEIATTAAATLLIAPPANVNIQVIWPDGGCADGNRVRTTLTYSYPLSVPAMFGFSSVQITAVSTMLIIN